MAQKTCFCRKEENCVGLNRVILQAIFSAGDLGRDPNSSFRSRVQGAPSVLGPRTVSNMTKSLVEDVKQRKLVVTWFFAIALVVVS